MLVEPVVLRCGHAVSTVMTVKATKKCGVRLRPGSACTYSCICGDSLCNTLPNALPYVPSAGVQGLLGSAACEDSTSRVRGNDGALPTLPAACYSRWPAMRHGESDKDWLPAIRMAAIGTGHMLCSRVCPVFVPQLPPSFSWINPVYGPAPFLFRTHTPSLGTWCSSCSPRSRLLPCKLLLRLKLQLR